jgi:hypothetical protein
MSAERKCRRKRSRRGVAARGASLLCVSGLLGGASAPVVEVAQASGIGEDSPAAPVPQPPRTVASWSLVGEPQHIAPSAIFDYMDGGGELYLAYRLERLEVYEYASTVAQEDEILVEVYALPGSDDAYGLLSQDWGGEPSVLGPHWPPSERRALYGAGLLRIWSGDIFVRVMASLETEASRAAVLALGRALVAGRPRTAPPELVGLLPGEAGGRLRVRLDRHVYLRSHLVLNSAFFLATANVLDLGPDVEAVLAPYDDAQTPGEAPRSRLILVRYPTADVARRALAHFRAAYAPETVARAEEKRGAIRVEEGWAGWRLMGRGLALVLAAPDEKACVSLLDSVGMEALARASAE